MLGVASASKHTLGSLAATLSNSICLVVVRILLRES